MTLAQVHYLVLLYLDQSSRVDQLAEAKAEARRAEDDSKRYKSHQGGRIFVQRERGAHARKRAGLGGFHARYDGITYFDSN